MTHNQSRAERSGSAQYRKTGQSGSSNQQRNFPAGGFNKGVGGASSAQSNSGSRSFKKYNNSNGQGGQSWARSPNVDSDSAANAVQNGPPLHQPTQRVSNVPVTSAFSNVKPAEAPSQKISRAVPKAPSSNVPTSDSPSNVSATNPEVGIPTTPVKGEGSKSFPLQFGSISPGLVNGVQIPARTSSAPPNLDEQKKEQARRELSRTTPMPVPSIPKNHLQKDDQNKTGEPQPVSKPKRDPQISIAPPPQVTPTQKPAVHHIPGMPPMQMPFHQPQVPVQFGGPGPQIQSQPMSLPMQMQLPIGNPQMQQPMFITGLQPHPLQSQGIMHHQGQNFNFSAPMSHQLPPQMGNMGINMGPPQFPQQQQAGKYSGGVVPRKTVKITHPDTHEELMLDGSSGPRSHPNVPPQSQPITSFPLNHPVNFYHNSYNAGSVYIPAASSVSMNSNPVPPTSQPLRITKQVTVKAPVVSHVEKEPMPAKSSASVGKAESMEPVSVRPPKVVEPSSLSSFPQSKHDLGASKSSADEARNVVVVSAPIKDEPNESINIGQQDQVGQSLSEAEAVKAKPTLPVPDLVPETDSRTLMTTVGTLSDSTYNLTSEGAAEMKTDDISTKDVISSQSEPEIVSGSSKSDKSSLETSLKSLSLESPEITSKKLEESSDQEVGTGIAGFSKSTDENPDDVKRADKIVTPDEKSAKKSAEVNKESDPVLASSHTEGALKPENDDNDNNSAVQVSSSSSIVKDKVSSDANTAKGAAPRGTKKKKELYRKAEAAGASTDLYNAYKGPEEKKEPVTSAESTETPAEVSYENDSSNKKPALGKAEPEDWEDAAENSPQLGASKNENRDNDRDQNGLLTKKYSRDFLLKFVVQCADLPEGFEIPLEVADALMASKNSVRESYPSPGRNVDRPNSRSDRRSSGLGDEDKWNKSPGPLMSGRGDMSADVGYYAGNNVIGGFRPGQGGNFVGHRNPRAQAPVHYGGGILPGPMQFLGPQGGGPQRNNADSDRWQRATGFMKGLIPHPQAPVPVIHRAEKKYEIGKVTDEEQAKQRQLKGILNKLTPQNFEKLFQQVKEVNIDNVVTLSGVISQIFDKALMEPTFCEMYADFCFHLAADLPELSVDNEKITFKRLLLNKCQEEFERGEREEEEANKAEEEGESKQTPEEREEKRLRVRRRMLGNIRLIGELYKKRMLTERIMHECINKLMGQYQNPDEENIEALCKLMSTIGEMIDHPKAKDHMDAYFGIMAQLSNDMRLSSRVRFMLKDSIDLRRNKWQQRRKVEGPKKIEEVHRDAAQERHAQSSRLARVPSMGSSARRGPPMEFAPRGAPSMISSSPGPQMGGGFHNGPPQARGGYSFSQDARSVSFENNRAMHVPLPQRPLGDDNITLGPQGGLVKGMGFRGQQSMGGVHLAEMPSPWDARRVGQGPNEFNPIPERVVYGQRENLMQRYGSGSRFVAPTNYDAQERSTDHGFDRSLFASPPQVGPPIIHDVSSDKVWPEEQLREKSMTTIKEFYSARDENEVVLCIKDLNTPSFYPSMISIWLADSFERKDKEREVLTDLLINLSNREVITEDQLVKGFESVLAVLEDAVNDAPRAAEFLGHTFARVVTEKLVSLSEIGRMIYEGGEEQGRLVEIGLAADVLGSTLDTIKSEKGDSVLNEIRSGSNIRLENFRPPGSKKSLKIDKFM
ncbi:hypothetical protein CASFOL_041156 [Castilleja foliolosa]|uniref:Eukaryotic translation initiation factor 4G n=1 Tax=Castilleja foliolosa TaxID=1961234 RepID=A0ABD3BDP1_9LAMI